MASTHKQDRSDFIIEFPSLGNIKCVEVLEWEVDDEQELEAVGDVSSDRPPGIKTKRGAITITVTETPGIPPQVAWEKPHATQEAGVVTTQYKGGGKKGQRIQYTPVFVSKIKPAGMNADGESQREITLLALGKQEN